MASKPTATGPAAQPAKPTKRSKSPFISFLIRGLATVAYLLTTLPIIYACIPLRLLHPVLRFFGVTLLPMDLVQVWWTRGLVAVAGVRVRREGMENIRQYKDKAKVYMFSHASNLDGFICAAYCPGSPKFVFKTELLWQNPPIAWFGWAAGHIPIDRRDRTKAIASLEAAKHKIYTYQRSVAVSPEGTRSPTGDIVEFKKAVGALGVPIVPVILHGNYDLWPPGQIFASAGEVTLRFAPAVLMTPGMTRDELAARVHEVMVAQLADLRRTHRAFKDSSLPALAFLGLWSAAVAAALSHFGWW